MSTQKNAPQKVLMTLFPFIFQVKTTWNIVSEYSKTKIFSRDINILPHMQWTLNIFGPSAILLFFSITKLLYPILNFKKMVCPKKAWMWHNVENKVYIFIAISLHLGNSPYLWQILLSKKFSLTLWLLH